MIDFLLKLNFRKLPNCDNVANDSLKCLKKVLVISMDI